MFPLCFLIDYQALVTVFSFAARKEQLLTFEPQNDEAKQGVVSAELSHGEALSVWYLSSCQRSSLILHFLFLVGRLSWIDLWLILEIVFGLIALTRQWICLLMCLSMSLLTHTLRHRER